jgi:group I intron endonuclease
MNNIDKITEESQTAKRRRIYSEDHKFYIYKITNLVNRKIYIGQSVSPDKRWYGHKRDAKNNPKQVVDFAIKKYGEDNFIFELIASCYGLINANATEDYLVDFYESRNKTIGYNVRPGGNARGKWTDEDRKKLSDAKKGRHTGPKIVPPDDIVKIIIESKESGKVLSKEIGYGISIIKRVRVAHGIIRTSRDNKRTIHFTEAQITNIQSDIRPAKDVAKEYGCSKNSIWRMREAQGINIDKIRFELTGKNSISLLTAEQLSSILSDPRSAKVIGPEFGLGKDTIIELRAKFNVNIEELCFAAYGTKQQPRGPSPKRGKPLSDGTKKKLSESLKGHEPPNKTKFTDDQITAILADKRGADIIGAEFGVTGSVIHNLRRKNGISDVRKIIFTEYQIDSIISDKRTHREIAKDFGVSRPIIDRVFKEHAALQAVKSKGNN